MIFFFYKFLISLMPIEGILLQAIGPLGFTVEWRTQHSLSFSFKIFGYANKNHKLVYNVEM